MVKVDKRVSFFFLGEGTEMLKIHRPFRISNKAPQSRTREKERKKPKSDYDRPTNQQIDKLNKKGLTESRVHDKKCSKLY